jgi:chromosome segregation ATPase
MGFLRRWLGPKKGARSPRAQIEAALLEERARYAELRASAAACLYVVHKLGAEVARYEAVAARSREAARRALATRDVARSRSMVARARSALDMAREAEAERAELRANADAALEGLRRLGETIGELERDRLRALAALPTPRLARGELEEARRALEMLEAERELERELGHAEPGRRA